MKKILSILILLTAGILYCCSHGTYYQYNDWWIQHKTIPEIIQKYGSPDYGNYQEETAGEIGYYIYTDQKGFLPDHLRHYYEIQYDVSGRVIKISDTCQKGG
ncbi:MAG: hypothetical protein IJ642_07245 [Oscillospiraceae bacterium]|nr:hypothetical protein [Oscillospiraceae bacterium]